MPIAPHALPPRPEYAACAGAQRSGLTGSKVSAREDGSFSVTNARNWILEGLRSSQVRRLFEHDLLQCRLQA